MIPALAWEPAETVNWNFRAQRAGWGGAGGRAPACCSVHSASGPVDEKRECAMKTSTQARGEAAQTNGREKEQRAWVWNNHSLSQRVPLRQRSHLSPHIYCVGVWHWVQMYHPNSILPRLFFIKGPLQNPHSRVRLAVCMAMMFPGAHRKSQGREEKGNWGVCLMNGVLPWPPLLNQA